MKRDLDLIRGILMEVEELAPRGYVRFINATAEERRARNAALVLGPERDIEFCDPVRFHHARLLWDSGYVREHDLSGARKHGSIVDELYLSKLTMEGYDFLDSIRDKTVWSKTKEQLKVVGGSAPIEVVKAVAVEMAKKVIIAGLGV